MKTVPFSNKKVEKWVNEGVRFYCFGAGAKLRALCKQIDGFENQIICIADNNSKLWGSYFSTENSNILIQNPSEVKPKEKKSIVLLTTSFYEQVAEQLDSLEGWEQVKKAYFFPHPEELHFYKYQWAYKKLKPKRKMIFRSGNYHYIPGWDYTDNAKALFDYMISKGLNKEYRMIWLVHEPKDYPEIKKIKNVNAISYDWVKTGNFIQKIRYFYHLRTASYLFFTDAMYWTRFCGKDQLRVNLWHGNGFKAKKNKKGAAVGSHFDCTTVSGPLYLDLHAEYFGCDKKKVFDTGLAKEDLLFEKLPKGLDEILNIKKVKKYIFWLPTFRTTMEGMKALNEYEVPSDTGLPLLRTMEQVEEINTLLSEQDMFLIIKLHPIQEKEAIMNINMSNLKVFAHLDIAKTGFQINSLLSEADALISDFSSVAVDYVLLDRPLAFSLEDEELYKENRGFVFDPLKDYLPGKELYSYEDMKQFILDISNEVDTSYEKRHKMLPLMHSHRDGNSRQRILELIGIE